MGARPLSPAELDRAAGAVLGAAFGDALGSGYECGRPLSAADPVEMRAVALTGAPAGTWTDGTELAACVLAVGACGELTSAEARDAVAARFADWYAAEPPDVALTTAGALGGGARTADAQRAAARAFQVRNGRTAGSGSLVRSVPIAVTYLHRDPGPELDAELVAAARGISELTHADPYAGDAAVLWTFAIDRAIRGADFRGVLAGLEHTGERRRFWLHRINAAMDGNPGTFDPNGYAPDAFCAALAAVAATDCGGPEGLVPAVEAAVRAGDDRDTVAALAGALAGARWGATAVPARYRRMLRGWPGMNAGSLVRAAVNVARGGNDDAGWPGAQDLTAFYGRRWDSEPFTARLHTDPGVVLGNVFALPEAPADAFVSLCRIGVNQLRPVHVEVNLADSEDLAVNPNLAFVVADTAAAIAQLRAEGRTVFVHCVEGRSRTPLIAAAYLVGHCGVGISEAMAELASVLPRCEPNQAFVRHLATLATPVPA